MAKKPDRYKKEIPIDKFESPGLLGDLTDLKSGNSLTQRLGSIHPIPDAAFHDPDFGTDQSGGQPPGLLDQMHEMGQQAKAAIDPTVMAAHDSMQNGMGQAGTMIQQLLQRAQQGASQLPQQANEMLDRGATRYTNPLGITNRQPHYGQHEGTPLHKMGQAYQDLQAGQHTKEMKENALERYNRLKQEMRKVTGNR